MNSPVLQQLKTETYKPESNKLPRPVRQLSKLMNALDQRSNLLMSTILNGLIFWELRQVMRIEKWKETHASDLPRWIETIGEIDAYCSLASLHTIIRIISSPKSALNPFICEPKLWVIHL